MKNLYLFDCFGVVISDVSTLWMDRHMTAEQIDYIRTNIFRKVDCGHMTLRQALVLLAEMAKIPLETALCEWEEDTFVLSETLPVLQQLKQQGHTVALLSNAESAYVFELFSRFDLAKYFDKIFVSSDLSCAKPDEEIYRACLGFFTEKFHKIYFVDNDSHNLVGLEKLGITPILFTDAEGLKKDLKLQ